jgi:septum formation protein
MNPEKLINKPIIILASSSLNRKKILENLGLSFNSISPDIKEEKITAKKPSDLVQKISYQKAQAVAQKLPPGIPHLIIAADSLAFLKGKILGKPANKKEAKKMLRFLSGQTHQFYTGICVIITQTQETYQDYAKTEVTFKELTDEEIQDYINSQPVTTMAGSYNIEKGAPGKKFLANIQGSYTNVLGLPLEKLQPIFEKHCQ